MKKWPYHFSLSPARDMRSDYNWKKGHCSSYHLSVHEGVYALRNSSLLGEEGSSTMETSTQTGCIRHPGWDAIPKVKLSVKILSFS